MLTKPVADALRTLLAQATAKSKEEAQLITRCWEELEANEAPLPVIHATLDAPAVPSPEDQSVQEGQ